MDHTSSARASHVRLSTRLESVIETTPELYDPDRTVSILHVDDDPDFLDLAATFLERQNDAFHVATATDAHDALSRLDEDEFDCVVSDFDMPELDGLELFHEVRKRKTALPFILFTGKGSEEIASRAISAGVTDYLQKDVGTDQYTLLANRVENAVREFRATRHVERGFQAMATTREGISMLDSEGRFRYVNDAFADIVRRDRESLLGTHWEVLYPEEDVDEVHEEILPGVPVDGRWTETTTFVRGDGTLIEVDHALAYTDSGTLICLIQEG